MAQERTRQCICSQDNVAPTCTCVHQRTLEQFAAPTLSPLQQQEFAQMMVDCTYENEHTEQLLRRAVDKASDEHNNILPASRAQDMAYIHAWPHTRLFDNHTDSTQQVQGVVRNASIYAQRSNTHSTMKLPVSSADELQEELELQTQGLTQVMIDDLMRLLNNRRNSTMRQISRQDIRYFAEVIRRIGR